MVRRLTRRIDLHKPVHVLAIGAVIGGILAPVAGYLATSERYRLQTETAAVLTRASPGLAGKLTYDERKKADVFNPVAATAPQDKLTTQIGGGSKASNQLYTATLPKTITTGITIKDNVNDMTVGFRPADAVLDGRSSAGRVVYPLKDRPGQLIYTPLAGALKEDILLTSSPGDVQEYAYVLDIPKAAEARLDSDGSVGIYTADPTLYGRITYSTEADRKLVEQARLNGTKTYRMFRIPAPTVAQTVKRGTTSPVVTSRFSLAGSTLTVHVSGLDAAAYPLSIDPTFVVTSSQDFGLGRAEDNVDFSTPDQIGRAVITGGAISGWTTTSALSTAGVATTTDYNFGMTAYNGFLYLIGGGDGASTNVFYAPINANGSLGNWVSNANKYTVGRTGGATIGYNGFVYIMGGENAKGNVQYATVEFAKVQADGSLGTWATTSAMTATRSYFGAAVYNGIIYASAGSAAARGTTLRLTTEYAKIKADGTLSTWTASTSIATARSRHGMTAYNNFLYTFGGQTTSAALGDVQYAAINADGSIGTWVATTSMSSVRRGFGYAVEQGHMYVYGGCAIIVPCTTYLSTTDYTDVRADGTIGKWSATGAIGSARADSGSASYNGYLYNVGGCTAEPSVSNNNCNGELGDAQYTSITVPGNVEAPVAGSTMTSARTGAGTIASNGYLYSVGGCSVTSCTSYSSTVETASIGSGGTLGSWATTTAVPASTGMNAGRYGLTLSAFKGRLFACGGVQKTTGGTDSYASDCFSAAQGAAGSVGAWSTEANTFTGARGFHAAGIYANRLYLVGGTDNATWYNNVVYAPISATGTLGTWATATATFATGRSGLAAIMGYGNLYVIGGVSSTGTVLSDVQSSAIDTSGNITTAFGAGTSLPAGRAYMGASVHNNVIYLTGGVTATAPTTSILYVPLTGATGIVGTWVTAAQTLATARHSSVTADDRGYLYVSGGCTTALPCTGFTATTEVIRPNNGSTGELASFTTSANAFSGGRTDAQYVASGGYIYVIGGCTVGLAGSCTAFTTSVQSVKVNPNGSLPTWSANTALPAGRSYGQAVVYNKFLYVMSGSVIGNATTTSVVYAPIGLNGVLGSWVDTASNYLPAGQGRYGFGAAVIGSHMYVAGGNTGAGAVTTVYYASAQVGGGLSADAGCGATWCATTALPVAIQDVSAVAFNGQLYISGGYDGTNSVPDTLVAAQNPLGTLAVWNPVTAMDRTTRYRQMVAGNGYVYFLGNESTGTEVKYANINANATLGVLNDTAAMPTIHPNGGAVFVNGFVYALGGCLVVTSGSCTSLSTAVEYAGQQATPRLAHYTKIFDTQVDTAPSQVLVNGALGSPSSTIILKFQTASSANPVLGQAQVFDPTLFNTYYAVQALDSTGTNTGVAFTYLTNFTLDDSASGAFPDSNVSGTQTAVTDFTLFYHANPTRRLRHGASFTNTGCNTVPANGCVLDTAP